MTAAAAPSIGTRDRLCQAALRVVARSGPSASVRAIAREAGVTEGALYRHFPSREHLLGVVFAELVEPMVCEKENLVAMRAPVRDRLREWVRCTYARFDRGPDGFAYVFLTDHDIPAEYARWSGRQSALLRELLGQGIGEGSLRAMPIDLMAALFISLLLSVPAGIYRKALKRPAVEFVDEVSEAIWRAIGVS